MVAKINSGSNLYGAITYNYEKVKAGKGTVLETNRMIENMNPEQDLHVHLAMKSFEPYLLANKRTSKPIVHISINPDIEDKLTDEQYISLVKDYLAKMNFQDQPYVIYKHEDIDRIHLHIVTTRLDENGKKKVSDSYENIRNKQVCRELEVAHGLKKISSSKIQASSLLKKLDYQKGDIKSQIHNTVRTLLETYKFQSFGEYNALLSCFHIHAKQVRGEDPDNPYKGVVYSAMNDKGKLVGTPIKSSLLSKGVGYTALEEQMKKHSAAFKKRKLSIQTKNRILSAMNRSPDMDTFRKTLQTYNMDVVFRINETGRIYGVTFIDHSARLVYNGSRIGKECSANVFNSLYNEKENKENQAPSLEVMNGELDFGAMDMADNTFVDVDEIFGTFHLKYHGEDPELTARKNRRKRKK